MEGRGVITSAEVNARRVLDRVLSPCKNSGISLEPYKLHDVRQSAFGKQWEEKRWYFEALVLLYMLHQGYKCC
jgi:hypothetical protein